MFQALALLSAPVVFLELMVSVKLTQLLEDVAAFLEKSAGDKEFSCVCGEIFVLLKGRACS